MSRSLALVLLVTACDAGAKPTPPPPPVVREHVLLASLERGGCYGSCPVYSFTVYRDGQVEYVGEDFVKKKGTDGGMLTDAQLAALDKLFIDGKFLAYKDSYESYDETDASSAKTAYQPVGAKTSKTVAHYYGDLHAPASLTELETKFDDIVLIERWIGTPAERDKVERQR